MRKGERNVMLLFLSMAAAATALATTFGRPEARLFPLIIAGGTTVLIVAYFVIHATPALKEKLHVYIEDDIFMKISAASDALPVGEAEEAAEATHRRADLPEAVRIIRERAVFSFLGGFLVVAWLAGLTVATPALLLSLMVGYSKKSWPISLIVTAVTSGFMYLVFVVVLRMPLHFGVLEGLL